MATRGRSRSLSSDATGSGSSRLQLAIPDPRFQFGTHVLGKVAPDEPFGGGVPGVDFDAAAPNSTGQILQFRLVPAVAPDPTTPPHYLVLPRCPRCRKRPLLGI